jgi:UDP-N-acetylglucosamine 2-epimerase (non-hydrolysing)
VDQSGKLRSILEVLLQIREHLEVVFPVHPRTKGRIESCGLDVSALQLLEPLPYLRFLALQRYAAVVITDSGGVQEETTYLGVPCLTLRANTERPVTLSVGSNVLVGEDLRRLPAEVARVLEGKAKVGGIPPLWDGHAAERIAKILLQGG